MAEIGPEQGFDRRSDLLAFACPMADVDPRRGTLVDNPHVRAGQLGRGLGDRVAGAQGIVKERMDDSTRMGRALGRIQERLRSKRQLEEIAGDADAIARAATRMPSLFPPGSGEGHTEAKAAVWEKWPDFVAASRTLAGEAEALAAAARSGQDTAIMAQVSSVTRACGGCHEALRAKP